MQMTDEGALLSPQYIVTCTPIDKQQLSNHIPAEKKSAQQ
jgi:hypothetical protein